MNILSPLLRTLSELLDFLPKTAVEELRSWNFFRSKFTQSVVGTGDKGMT